MPDYEITSPEGKRFRITAPDGATQEQVLAYAQQQFAASQSPVAARPRFGTGKSFDVTADGSLAPSDSVRYGPESQTDQFIQAGKNVAEAGAHFATAIPASLTADVAGLGTMFADIATMRKFDLDPEGVRQRVASHLTYQPSDPNSLSARIVTAPGRMIAGAGEELASMTDNETAKHFLRAVPMAAASALGVKAGAPATFNAKAFGGSARQPLPQSSGLPAMAPEPTAQEIAIKNARDAGYKLAPDKANAPVGTAAAKVAGHADLERELSIKNASITDNIAKKELGIAQNRELSDAVLNEVRMKANKPYNDISRTGKVSADDSYRADIERITDRSGAGSFSEDTPAGVVTLKKIYANKKAFDAGDAVSKIRQLRADASKNIKAPNDPERNALGHAQRAVAEALDSQLERHVSLLGKPELATQYKAARVQLAKLHSIEDAFEGGHVSARELARQKGAGVPLSGGLKTVADSFEFFDRVMQEPGKIRARGPLGALDYFIGVGGAAANPALAAAVLARPAVRAALGSNAYQNRLARGPKRSQAPQKVAPSKTAAPAAVSTGSTSREQQRARR